jgi:hypothetical protein
MMDSANNVLPFAANVKQATESPAPPDAENQNIIERFQRFKEENPDAIEYVLSGEEEAQIVLIAIIPTLRALAADVKIPEDRAAIIRCANQFQASVVNRRALNAFRKMDHTNQVSIAGIKITARKRWGH